MSRALAAAILVAAAGLAGGCAESSAAVAGKRVVVVSPRGAGPVDAHALATQIAGATRSEVSTVEVDVLSPESVRLAAHRIVAAHPALIVAPSSEMAFALRDETQAIPILFVTLSDPIQTGLVPDEARPRGNLSGFTFHVPIGAKQLELLLRAFPAARRVGVIGDRALFGSSSFRMLADAANGPLHVEVERLHFEDTRDLALAFASPAAARVDAWIVPDGAAAFRHARELVQRIEATGKPAIYGSERFVSLGGLMSYAPAQEDPSSRVVSMARSVLGGFPVGDLPVERPQSFRLAINTVAWSRFRPLPPREVLVLATDFFPADERR
jgi:putative ABC transport system substrate-binding protein